jgi:hypothetical protein
VTGPTVLGKVYCVEYRPGNTDTGATITVTANGDVAQTLLSKATAGTSNTWYYPRSLQHNPADGAALTGTAGGDRAMPVASGYLKLVVSAGGNATSGSVLVYLDESG